MKIVIAAVVVLAIFTIAYVFKGKKQPQMMAPGAISYSQVDITEHFGDNERLKPNDWLETVPINVSIQNPEQVGLPPLNASAEEVYETAARLSKLREQIPVSNDGVYCPICHIANIDIGKLNIPCPKCGRKLLKFGWD